MIARMQHLDLVCLKTDSEATLEKLRELGAVHLDLAVAQGEGVNAVRGEIADAEKAVRLVLRARGKTPREELNLRDHSVAEVLELAADRDRQAEERDRLIREIKFFEPYGDFDPELAKKLLARGIDLQNELPPRLPEARLSRMQEKLRKVSSQFAVDEAKLAAVEERSILKRYPQLGDRLAFEQAKEILADHGAVTVVSGWIPESETTALETTARSAGWGLWLRPPTTGECPPTLINPPKCFRAVRSLFAGLGIAPAYDESDVSVPFLAYFSIFFAMLVGDGAYGAIFLAVTLLMRRKLAKSWYTLLLVFSIATIGWGLLSDTWFGASIPFLANPVSHWLDTSVATAQGGDADYQHIMLICFTLGVSHLMLARIWNGICKLNDTTAVAEFGWAGILLFMYFITNKIVGIFPSVPDFMFWVFGLSILAVFGFSVKFSELKTRGAELGMLPLSIMSALGDIISYVRLFAVGLASVKVAENFNQMAIGLLDGADGWALKALMAIAMVAVLVFGHALNLAMAGLSVLVHAVRLNTLEFSNHKGVSWSGYAYHPFKSNKSVKS